MKRIVFGLFLLLSLSTTAHGDLLIVNPNVATVITFDSSVTGSNNGAFTGAGLTAGATSTGQLDSNSWAVTGLSDGDTTFGGSFTSGDFARGASPGAVTTGGLYGFDRDSTAGVNRVLGIQPGGTDFAPGSVTLKIKNSTGQAVTDFDLGYDVWVLNNEPRANSFNFSYSTDGVTFTPVGAFDFTSPLAADPFGWTNTSFFQNFAVTIANGGQLFLRWSGDDVSGSNNRDEFGLDDISIAFNVIAVPEPTSLALGALAFAGIGLRRRRR